jgi:hypothetical protein
MWNLSYNKKLLALILLSLFVLSYTAHSEVISGVGYLTWGTWDFSEQKSYEETYGDIMVVYIVDPPLGLKVVAIMPPTLIAVVDSTYEELLYAPEDTTLYDWLAPVELGLTYVCRTYEKHYAKFRFMTIPPGIIKIEYTYQPDGSSLLFDPDPIDYHSWSEIKHMNR